MIEKQRCIEKNKDGSQCRRKVLFNNRCFFHQIEKDENKKRIN